MHPCVMQIVYESFPLIFACNTLVASHKLYDSRRYWRGLDNNTRGAFLVFNVGIHEGPCFPFKCWLSCYYPLCEVCHTWRVIYLYNFPVSKCYRHNGKESTQDARMLLFE